MAWKRLKREQDSGSANTYVMAVPGGMLIRTEAYDHNSGLVTASSMTMVPMSTDGFGQSAEYRAEQWIKERADFK